MDYELFSGYQGAEKDQLADVLRKLLPCLDLNNIYFCGDIAIRYHLTTNQKQVGQESSQSLDLCAVTLDAVLPKVKGQFEVVNLEHAAGGDNFFLKLHDPEQKIKINVFDNQFPSRDPVKVQFENWMVLMRNAEDQLVKSVFDHDFEDAKALWEIVDKEKAQKYWLDSLQNNPLFKGLSENLEKLITA